MFSPQFQTKPLTPIFKRAVSVVIVIPSSKQRPSSQFLKKTVFVRVCHRNFAALPNCKLNLFYAFYAFVFKRKHTQVRKHGRPFIIHLIIAKTILAGLSPCLGSDIFCQIGVGAVVCVMCMPRIDLKLLSLLLL